MRTLPAYWLVVTILIPIWLIVLKKNLTWKVLLYYVFLQNMATPHPGFFSVAWSLSVEEWFYLTLPLCVLIAGRNITTINSGRWLLRCLLAYMMGAICLRIGNASLLPYGSDFDNGIRKMVITRLDAPLYGVIIAWYLYYKPQLLHFKSYLLSISLIATMLLAALMYYLEPGGPHMHHWLYLSFNTVLVHTLLPMAMALCLPAAVAYSNSGKSLWQKAASYVARISYSVYLTHYYLFYLLPFSRVHFVSVPAQMMFYSLYLLVVCLVSSLLYYVVEKPMLRLRDYLFPTVGSSTNAVAA
jgi:peptidoglycan/LPS O-acetylase OafA/YrhL